MTGGTGMPGRSGMNQGSGMNNQNDYDDNDDNGYDDYDDNDYDDMNDRDVMSEENGYDNMVDANVEELVNDFRKLWEQHVVWTRMAVMGLVHDLPETDLILQRLLRNPLDFAAALQPFYGDEVAKNFANLLTQHLMIAAELVRAAKAGNSNDVSDADQRWRQNAEEMADFLASINSEWNEEDWNAMLEEHLDLLSKNVADMLSGNYEESIQGFDDIEDQALEMADVMADGIMMQFMD
ncbi:MAG: hypothetical protein K0S04_1802 [Herbinix sp.]|nr:hypothetical protein [Herbinix sp.]